jgi:poly(A) polymerase
MPSVLENKAVRIVRRLAEAGHRALFAGGCVRDMLRGEEPHDYDVATDATPEEVQALFERTVAVGIQFGVIVVVLGDDQFEVATFRTDEGYSDGRHPDAVHFADAEDDAQRRDFTINALFYDPVEQEVLDFVGGQEDLRAGIVRAVGDPSDRFVEDSLRMLRAVRFAARFGFRIEKGTLAALRRHGPRIRAVSAERIREELARLITGPNPGAGLTLARDTGLLGHVLPEVQAMVGCEQPEEFHPEGDVFAHTCKALELADNPSVTLAFGILLHDVGKPLTRSEGVDRTRFHRHDKAGADLARRVCERLRFSTAEAEVITDLVASHMRFMHVQDMRLSTLKRLLRNPHIEEHLELCRVDCLASHADLANYQFCREKLVTLREEEIRPPRLLSGHDLIDLGYRPGPVFTQILDRVEDAQLEGEVSNREDALILVRKEFPRLRDARPG